MASNAFDLLIEVQASMNRVREMRRVIKAILQNRTIGYRYETYLKKNTTIKSARTIQDYVNPKHSSTVFNTFKYLEPFLNSEQEWVASLEPTKIEAFMVLNEKLKEVKASTIRMFQNTEISARYEAYLLDMGMSKPVSKKWSSPKIEWTEWFDSMEHLPSFFAKNDRHLRTLLEQQVTEQVEVAAA